MKILLWTEGFWPHIGGVAIISSQFILALQKRGYECVIVTSRHSMELAPRDSYYGIPVYRLPFSQALVHRNMNEISAIREQVLEIKECNPDIIHFQECGPSALFHLLTQSACSAPTIITVQSILPQTPGAQGLLLRMLRSASRVAAVSYAMLDDLHALVPEIAARCQVIHDGLDMPTLEPTHLDAAAFEAPRLLCVGRVVRDKGFDVALAALARLLPRFPKARLIIAGDGDARSSLETQAEQLGVRHAVNFTGWVPPESVPALINTATLVIMPSRWREPFGLVAVQAGQMARPIVATRVGGLPEIVAHQESGLLVENEDDEGLADVIAFLLEHPKTAQQMGRVGRQRASEMFTMDRFVEAHTRLYQEVGR